MPRDQASVLEELQAIRGRADVLRRQQLELDDERDALIREALLLGTTAPALGRILNLTAGRIYQIRDGRNR